jgi:hypothetical protein
MCQYPFLQTACLTPEHADDDTPGTSWNTDSLTRMGLPSPPLPMFLAASNSLFLRMPVTLSSLGIDRMLRTASLTCGQKHQNADGA